MNIQLLVSQTPGSPGSTQIQGAKCPAGTVSSFKRSSDPLRSPQHEGGQCGTFLGRGRDHCSTFAEMVEIPQWTFRNEYSLIVILDSLSVQNWFKISARLRLKLERYFDLMCLMC